MIYKSKLAERNSNFETRIENKDQRKQFQNFFAFPANFIE